MDAATIKKILDVIASQDQAAALALLPDLVANDSAEETAEGAPPAGDGSTAALDGAPAPDPTKAKPGTEAAALRKELDALRATDQTEVKKLRAELDAIKADRTAIESAERVELVTELVKLGVETPFDAWQGEPDSRKPKARFEAEPLVELRARVARRQAEGPLNGGIQPPASGEGTGGKTITTKHGAVTLSASEVENCESLGAKLEAYAENKAIREASRVKARK